MLKAIESSSLFSSTSVVQVPRVLLYDSNTHTLVMSDHTSTRLLSDELCECLENGDPARIRELSSQIGAALGDFLGRFHEWTSLPEQAELRTQFLGNTASIKDALALRYQYMRDTASKFGLERDWMDGMVQEGLRNAEKGGSVIAMADFWFSKFTAATVRK